MTQVGFDPRPGQAEEIATGIRRILAPNPSPMTFRGTNTYILGRGAVALIDPGPDDPAHLDAIFGALAPGEVITDVFVTHSHLDHSPLARRVGDQTGARILGFGPAHAGRREVMTRLARDGGLAGGEGVDHGFEPDKTLYDGETVQGPDWTVTALHTPGHMANHLCFSTGSVIFSGDHVMGWSTSLVSPPDGDLGAFMASCARLGDRPERIFLPGHGAPVIEPQARLKELVDHRRSREAQILLSVRQGHATVADITLDVYSDTPEHLHRAAARNVLAHLIDLTERGFLTATPRLAEDASFTPAD